MEDFGRHCFVQSRGLTHKLREEEGSLEFPNFGEFQKNDCEALDSDWMLGMLYFGTKRTK